MFDFATFAVLLWVLKADMVQFRTAWFLESVVSATLIVLVVRTRRPMWKSRPSRWLTLATLLAIFVTISLPWLPFADLLGFAPPSAPTLIAIAVIIACYGIAAEVAKAMFYRRRGG